MPQAPPPKRHPYDQWAPDARALDLVGDKWTLLIIRDLSAGPRRFVELQRVLPGISTEQLRSRLNRMVADGLLTRTRYREVPPRVDYDLTDRAREVMPVLGELARWGYEWAWSPPRSAEAVDVTAIFRLAAGIITSGVHPVGTVELVLQDEVEAPVSYAVTVSAGEVVVRERPADHPDARVTGSTAGWVAALSPSRNRSSLTFTGDRDRAEQLLDELAGGTARPSAKIVAA